MNNALTDTLSPEQNLLWQQYLAAEAQGVRPQTLSALSKFVEALQADTQKRRDAFTEEFCCQMADDGVPLPLREPLFASIIGPYLVSSYQNRDRNAGRWLSHFYSQFRNMPPAQRLIDLPDLPSPMELLMQAYRRDPDNIQTQDALIQYYAQQFAYTVHEVPSGVLYGHDGATVAECEEWQNNLALFQEAVQRRGLTEKYETAVRYWNFHFHGYADYLTHRKQYQDYADYISRHWQE